MADRTDHGKTPEERLADHLAHVRSHTEREVANAVSLASVAETGIETFGNVLRELIKASTANPVIGASVAVITADMLNKGGLIRDDTRAMVNTMVFVAFGVDITVQVIDEVGSIIGFGNKSGTEPDLLKPVPTTIVYGSEVRSPKGGQGQPAIGGSNQPALPAGKDLMTTVRALAEVM